MRKFIQVRVDTPCSENLNAMSPTPQGSFCHSCNKTVIDFTAMSDNQLMEYFTKRTGNTCGHFYADQLNKNLEVPVKKIPWLQYFFTISIPAMLLSLKADAQTSVKRMQQTVSPAGNKLTTLPSHEKTFTVSGSITGEDGQPVPYASVIISGTNMGTSADSNGVYSLQLDNLKSTLEVSAVGYEKQVIDIPGSILNLRLQVALSDVIMLEAVTVRGAMRRITVGGALSVRGYRIKTQHQLPTKCSPPSLLSIFPNPASRNSHITIRFNNAIEHD